MKILVTIMMTALVVFAAATTWVDYVQPLLNRSARTTLEKPATMAEAPVSKKRSRKAVTQPSNLVPDPDDDDLLPDREPVARSEYNTRSTKGTRESVELLTQKMELVKQQESDLAARQETLRLIYDDIRTELATVEDLRKKTSDDLAEAERRGVAADKRRPTRSASTKNGTAAPRNANTNATASIRGEALFIRRLVEDGKTETAVSILKSMKARDAASVLEALSAVDSRLAIRLADTIPGNGDDPIRR